jgi:hypothetical protein
MPKFIKHPRTYKNPYRKMITTEQPTKCGTFKTVDWVLDRQKREPEIFYYLYGNKVVCADEFSSSSLIDFS